MKKALKVTLIVVLSAAVLVAVVFGIKIAYDQYIDSTYVLDYEEEVKSASEKYNVPQELIYGVIKTESSFNPKAVSSAGARGLMQITPDTFEWLNLYYADDKLDGKNPELLFEEEINIEYGTLLLSILIDRYGDVDTAICAYNAGLGNVDGWLEDTRYSKDGKTLETTPFEETNNYLVRVKKNRDKYKEKFFSN